MSTSAATSRSGQILDFYRQLELPSDHLPKGIRVMNPYQNADAEVDRVLDTFHHKFFEDHRPRQLILGINPGRFGAGVTGIPFTDSAALELHCDIPTSLNTRETSSEYVYQSIEAYGGAASFYDKWYIGAACPLGFIHQNAKGNWVNFNYYDRKDLQEALRPFILEQLRKQIALCGRPKTAVVWGTGKNYQYLKKLNQQEGLFEKLIPLEHPRYILQYKRRHVKEYLAKFLKTYAEVEQRGKFT